MIEELVDKYLSSICVEESKEIPVRTPRGLVPAIKLSLSVPYKFLQEYDFLVDENHLVNGGNNFFKNTDLFYKLIDAPSKELKIKLEDVILSLEQTGYIVNFKRSSCDRVKIDIIEKV